MYINARNLIGNEMYAALIDTEPVVLVISITAEEGGGEKGRGKKKGEGGRNQSPKGIMRSALLL